MNVTNATHIHFQIMHTWAIPYNRIHICEYWIFAIHIPNAINSYCMTSILFELGKIHIRHSRYLQLSCTFSILNSQWKCGSVWVRFGFPFLFCWLMIFICIYLIWNDPKTIIGHGHSMILLLLTFINVYGQTKWLIGKWVITKTVNYVMVSGNKFSHNCVAKAV